MLKVAFLEPIYRRKNPVTTGFDKEESHVLQTLRRRLQGEREGGFTLIELMVVVLIIAILIAIAIPTFWARAPGPRTGPLRPAFATPWWRPRASTPTPRATPPPSPLGCPR